MIRLAVVAVCMSLTAQTLLAEEISPLVTYRTDHVVISYSSGIGEQYAQAIARTVETARAVALEQFGFDMPEIVAVQVRHGKHVRLFNDGDDRLFLTVRSDADLRKPSDNGIFHVYGLCHEIGHLAMYRVIRDHSWMTTEAAEGWAHYIGSRLVDAVHERVGEELWPDRYNCLADGTERLNKQLKAENRTGIAKAAALWMELVKIVGDGKVGGILKAWGEANVDPADPCGALRKALLAAQEDERLANWWNRAELGLIFKRPKSGFAARSVRRSELQGKPMLLAHDDGKSARKKSIAGSGHAVSFEVEGTGWYLSTVQIYGSRYGTRRALNENFRVWLCDEDFKTIASFSFPYAMFQKGTPRWVRLGVKPTHVPKKFIICVGFNPTGTKGIFVHHDAQGTGHSWTGLPGRNLRLFKKGDWMIRVGLDQPRTSDPLRQAETRHGAGADPALAGRD